jgi:hypothetical protein
MTPQRGRSLATGPLALLLAVLALLVTAGWPVREDLANDAWRSVASARSLGLFVLAFAAGASLRSHPRQDLLHLLVAAVVTMPFEVAAHRGGAWQDPLAWSLGYAAALAWSVYGVT